MKGSTVEVGIRELRAGLSRWIEQVRAGEELIVTDSGTPVARIVPIDRTSAYERLVAAGLLVPPRVGRRDRRRPVPVRTDGPVSDLVGDQRR
jgi:prevent-host-death family protein